MWNSISCELLFHARCSLAHFGWVHSMATLPKDIDFGRIAETCCKRLWSKALLGIIYTVYSELECDLISIVQNQTYLILAGGHMSREALRMLPGSSNGLVRKYIDKAGKRRHAGVPSRLKGSQRLVEIIACQLITLESALCVSRCSSCWFEGLHCSVWWMHCFDGLASPGGLILNWFDKGGVCDWSFGESNRILYIIYAYCGAFAFGRYLQRGLGSMSTLTTIVAMQNFLQEYFLPQGNFPWSASVICGMMQLGCIHIGQVACNSVIARVSPLQYIYILFSDISPIYYICQDQTSNRDSIHLWQSSYNSVQYKNDYIYI